MRILAVGAHPDDIEFLCAGTLLKFRNRGDEIFTAVLCNGDKGHYEIGPEELARIRRLEAEEAAKSEGAALVSVGDFYEERELMSARVQLELREPTCRLRAIEDEGPGKILAVETSEVCHYEGR